MNETKLYCQNGHEVAPYDNKNALFSERFGYKTADVKKVWCNECINPALKIPGRQYFAMDCTGTPPSKSKPACEACQKREDSINKFRALICTGKFNIEKGVCAYCDKACDNNKSAHDECEQDAIDDMLATRKETDCLRCEPPTTSKTETVDESSAVGYKMKPTEYCECANNRVYFNYAPTQCAICAKPFKPQEAKPQHNCLDKVIDAVRMTIPYSHTTKDQIDKQIIEAFKCFLDKLKELRDE